MYYEGSASTLQATFHIYCIFFNIHLHLMTRHAEIQWDEDDKDDKDDGADLLNKNGS